MTTTIPDPVFAVLMPALGIMLVAMPLCQASIEVPSTLREYFASRVSRLAAAIGVLMGVSLHAANQVLGLDAGWGQPMFAAWAGYWISMGLLISLCLPSMRGRYGYTIPAHRIRYPRAGMMTPHLSIIRVPSTHLPFLLDHDQLGRLLQARIPDDWPPEFIDESTIAYVAEALAGCGDSRWWMYLLVTRDDPTLVGTCGYKGPPSEGTVEIGYSVIPSRQRNGYATEAAHALTRQALKAPQVAAVRAETIASRPASIRVLEKCGYYQIATRPEPELGEDVLVFECTEIE